MWSNQSRTVTVALVLSAIMATLAPGEVIAQTDVEPTEPVAMSPGWAAGMGFLIPTLGHAYAEDWTRGLMFLPLEAALAVAIAFSFESTNRESTEMVERDGKMVALPINVGVDHRAPEAGAVALLGLAAVKLWEASDAYRTTERTMRQSKSALKLRPELRGDRIGVQLAVRW